LSNQWSHNGNLFFELKQMLNAASILYLVGLAIYQYWIIVKSKPHISNTDTVYVILFVLLVSLIVSLLPFIGEGGYQVTPSQTYCSVVKT
jgi:uncharacterized membrane protein